LTGARTQGNASRRRDRRFHLKLSDIEGRTNPGIVYGVYVHPESGEAAVDEQHLVGMVSFFGVEQT
jgi:hypothetical protein